MKKGLGKGLGKGLDALIAYNEANDEPVSGGVLEVEIGKINPNPDQPRKRFDRSHIEELAESVKEFGIIQPIIVTQFGDNYVIVAGERRWRAAQHLGLGKIPVIVREYSGIEVLEIALIENIQREDLNPIEEANCYKKLNEEFSLTQEEIAKKVGKSRSHITNCIRLLRLQAPVQDFIINGELSMGHAKTLLSVDDQEAQTLLAAKIVEEGLSVRTAEELAKKLADGQVPEEEKPKLAAESKEKYTSFQMDLRGILGTRVNIRDNKTGGGGKIEINYFSAEDLNRIIDIVKKSKK
ncbi:MAG: ParB/RepB/Spo0J family partition protein [Defluviitaleaceae bacterium]|nr:ParB/RepB/Spo0J family partition protein [Defluviitaleaceae bacterium]